ncbi:hypothetical protein R1flu_002243 [Riccia fluitans]|uniref:Uncharacterized protein n=1 Tax=Riccia fluitans TaxID=41844 RepID=A0ABD1Y5U2_9MARC
MESSPGSRSFDRIREFLSAPSVLFQKFIDHHSEAHAHAWTEVWGHQVNGTPASGVENLRKMNEENNLRTQRQEIERWKRHDEENERNCSSRREKIFRGTILKRTSKLRDIPRQSIDESMH